MYSTFAVVAFLVAGSVLAGHHGENHEEHHESRVNGDIVDIPQYKYTVAVLVNRQFQCGGVILSPDYVLTNAQCVQGFTPSQVNIYAGSSSLQTGGTIYNTSSVVVHPYYVKLMGVNAFNDVAVIKVSPSLNFSSSIGSVKLPAVNELVVPGTVGDITGWGSDQGIQTSMKNAKMVVYLSNFCWKKCPQSFCAGNPLSFNAATCSGDQGGPFVANGKLVGLITANLPGLSCYNMFFSPVFLRISAVRDFIKTTTGL